MNSSNLKKILIILLLIAIVAAGILAIKHKKKELSSTPPPSKPPLAVQVATVHFGAFPVKDTYLGTIKAKVSADVASRVTSYILDVKVREGDAVKKGQLLAVLDNRKERDRVQGLKAEVKAAETAYSTQEAIYQRDKTLFAQKAISKEALERSKSSKDAARARLISLKNSLASALTDLSYTELKAPFDGIITTRFMDPGDLAVTGKPVISIESPSSGYFVEIKVPQEKLPSLSVGNPVTLSLAVDNKGKSKSLSQKNLTLRCQISRLHPAVQPGGLAVAEADTEKRPFSLPTGSSLEATVETGIAEGFLIPIRALLENVDTDLVFSVTENDTIHIVPVKPIYKGADQAVVQSSGLKDGVKVVVSQESGLLRLHEGQKVRIVEKDHE